MGGSEFLLLIAAAGDDETMKQLAPGLRVSADAYEVIGMKPIIVIIFSINWIVPILW